MLDYRPMTIGDYEAAYELWIKCGNGLNNKDDSYEGRKIYLMLKSKILILEKES